MIILSSSCVLCNFTYKFKYIMNTKSYRKLLNTLYSMAVSSPNNIMEFEEFDRLLEKLRQEIRCRFHELMWTVQKRESELLKQLESISSPFRPEQKKKEEKLRELRHLYNLNEQNFRSNELQTVQRNILKGLSDEMQKLKKEVASLPFEFSYRDEVLNELKELGEIKLIAAKQPAPPVPAQKPSASIYTTITHPIYGVCCKGGGTEELDRPWGLAIDYQTGNIFVADQCNSRVQVFNGDGAHFLTYMVSSGRGQMKWPVCLAIHNDKLFVSQHGNDCVTVFSLQGAFVNQFGKTGKKNGEFKSPRGIAINELSGDIFVCDYSNNRVQVFSGDYKFKSKFGNLNHPQSIQLSADSIVVLDQSSPCLHLYNMDLSLRRHMVTHGMSGQVRSVRTFCLDSLGNILMTDYDSNSICIFSPGGALLHEIHKGVTGPVGIILDMRGRIVLVSHREDNCLQFF